MFTRGSVTLFRARGVPIRAHWTLLLILPYLAVRFSADFGALARLAQVPTGALALPPLVWGTLLAVGLFASVLIHELAHTLVALRSGGRVREITLMMLGGVSQIERMPRRPSREGLMAAAGPLTSLLLAGLLWALRSALPPTLADARLGAFYLGQLNLILGLFNLLPAFPMDGGRLLRALMAGRLGGSRATQVAAGIGKATAVGLGLLGLWAGNLLLALIALFVYVGAHAEARGELARAALGAARVGDLMVARPATIGLDEPLADVPRRMREAGRLDLVAIDEAGQPVAVLCGTDLAALPPRLLASGSVRDLAARLAAHTLTVSADEAALEALERAARAGAEHLLVVHRGDHGVELLGLLGRREIEHALTVSALERRVWPPRRLQPS